MLIAGSLFAGGALGSTILGAGAAATKTSPSSTSSTTSSTTPPSGAPQGAPNGKFVPNENKAHETGESAQREAQEDAGQFPTVP